MARHEASPKPAPQPHATPAPLTPAWLRFHFDPLPHPARMSALARHARTLTPDAYATLRRTLDSGTADERHTALFLAVARRDLTAIAEALTDPRLRRRALAAAIRLPVPEHALEQMVLSDTRATRHAAYGVLRRSRRSALAARLLPVVYERHGAHDAVLLLPACPAATVSDWLPRLDAPLGVLAALARTAPTAVAEKLADLARNRADHQRYRFLRSHRALAGLAAERDTRAGLLLLEKAPDLLTPQAARSLLREPARVLEILRADAPDPGGSLRELPLPAGPLPPSVRRALRGLPPADLVELARRCPAARSRNRMSSRQDVAPNGLLLLLPPAERKRLAEDHMQRSGRGMHGIPATTLAALAPDDRARLVMPALEKARRRHSVTRRLASVLPLAQGEPLLRDMAGKHRIHERADGWPGLLACAELHGDPGEFARIAVDCERAWHDQEEVRRRTLEQLSGASPRLLGALPDRVLRDAALTTAQSRDSTAATLTAVAHLLRRSAESAAARDKPDRAAYAAGLLCHVITDPRFRRPVAPLRMTGPAAQALWAAMDAKTKANPSLTAPAAELLAPHLTALPALDTQVRRIALEHDDPDLAARAAAAWVAPAGRREQRCAELIAHDASFAAVPPVLRVVATRRTDLLTPVLRAAHEGLAGRLRPRASAWVPQLPSGLRGRWLPEQRLAWDELHARVAGDEHAPLRSRADAAAGVRDPALLTALAGEAPQPVAAAALGALGALLEAAHDGAPCAAEPLLEDLLRHAATGGVRGRAAMASVRRLLHALPDGDAVALLAPVVAAAEAPVGSRKEAARALGALSGAGAFGALLAAWDAPRQHRDVHAVVARFLLPVIGRPGVAERLVRRVDEPAVREAVIHARGGPVPESAAEAYTDFLARLVREGDEHTVAAACRALPGWLTPDAGDASRAVADVVADLERSPREWNAAAQQITCLPLDPVLRDLFQRLHELTGSADPQVRSEALRRLVGIAGHLHLHRDTVGTLRIAEALAHVLEACGLLRESARLTWEVALDSLRRGEHDVARWERLLALSEARPDRLPEVYDASVGVGGPRARAALLAAARFLRERGSPVSGVMAVALVRAGGRQTSWPQEWRDELDALRAHEDHDTAMAALLAGPQG